MLKIDNLHVRAGNREILKGLTLEVAPGQMHAIMGPNGAGKSTLGHILAGREGYEVTEGDDAVTTVRLNRVAETDVIVDWSAFSTSARTRTVSTFVAT